jgi:uncharacterized protein DUF2809
MKDKTTGRQAATMPIVILRTGLCAAIIVSGLALRRFGFHLGLPAGIIKYGGSALWGAMVFCLVAVAAPRLLRPSLALIAIIIADGVELFRLVHTPWLDDFRLTLAGALLLGRIFSAWNILAYASGILSALAVDAVAARCISEKASNPHVAN